MSPQDGVGGCVPRPRNERAASARIAKAIEMVACTMTGAMMFGRMCSRMMRQLDAPLRARRLDVGKRGHAQGLAAHDAREIRREGDADGEDRVGDARPEHGRYGEREEQHGEAEERIHEPHQGVVGPAAEVARDDAEGEADDEAQGHREDRDDERGVGAEEHAPEELAPELVGPEGGARSTAARGAPIR